MVREIDPREVSVYCGALDAGARRSRTARAIRAAANDARTCLELLSKQEVAQALYVLHQVWRVIEDHGWR